MIAVKYLGTFSENSGYAQASRNFITSLFMAGVDISTELLVQMAERSNYGWQGELCKHLQERKIDAKIKFLHITPDLYPRYMEKGMYHIGHLFWETDHLPKEWVAPCNQVNEIWTLSEQQAEMIKNSGVIVPIKWFPQPIDISLIDTAPQPFVVPNFDGVIFYSIFQWILRKNPEALLKTFLSTFQGRDDVCLVIKTYGANYSEREFTRIKEEISQWKFDLGYKKYPKVFLVRDVMTATDLFRIHKMGGVYVNTSCGEGNGIPIVEASLMGNPVISTDTTGFADYFSKDIYYPVPATKVRAKVAPHIPWYTGDMHWLNINQDKLAEAMLEVYNNLGEARAKGTQAQQFVKDNFNFWVVGDNMKKRLEEIHRFI